MVYPGVDGPLASTRLELLKIGFQDRALLALLPTPRSVEFASRLVSGASNFSVDPALLETVRREAAAALGTISAGACTSDSLA